MPFERLGADMRRHVAVGGKAAKKARGKNVNRIHFWNPFIPGIRFTVGTGLEIIAGHERRHLLQGKRVRTTTNFAEAFRKAPDVR